MTPGPAGPCADDLGARRVGLCDALGLGQQADRPMAALLLLRCQQVVGLDHVQQSRVAVGLGREGRVGALEVLAQDAQAHLAF